MGGGVQGQGLIFVPFFDSIVYFGSVTVGVGIRGTWHHSPQVSFTIGTRAHYSLGSH